MDNYNSRAIEAMLKSILGAIPIVGSLLSNFLSFFWPPTEEDIWNEIKGEVEKLIKKDISKEVYNRITDKLDGLEKVMRNYQQATIDAGSDKSLIVDNFVACKDAFDAALPSFKEEAYETLLLPLLVPVVEMKISLLRDAVLFGKDWGIPDI